MKMIMFSDYVNCQNNEVSLIGSILWKVINMNEKEITDGTPANNVLKIFEPWIGVWKTVGSHGMIPNTTLHGSTKFSWHESGAFILVKSMIEEEVGIPAGVAIISSDDKLGSFGMNYYDERGVSRIYNVSIEGNVLKWWRDAPEFSQRNTLTISEDKMTIVGEGEISKTGSNWERDLDLTYSKV